MSSFDVKDLQSDVPPAEFPVSGDESRDAHALIFAVKWSWCRIRDAEGRIAAEGRCLIHPGVLCVVPGESGVGRFNVISLRWKG